MMKSLSFPWEAPKQPLGTDRSAQCEQIMHVHESLVLSRWPRSQGQKNLKRRGRARLTAQRPCSVEVPLQQAFLILFWRSCRQLVVALCLAMEDAHAGDSWTPTPKFLPAVKRYTWHYYAFSFLLCRHNSHESSGEREVLRLGST